MLSRLPFLLILLFALLTGCCFNERCECADANADTIYLRFDRDTSAQGRGFTQAETDSFYLVRIALDTLDRPRRDTVQFINGLTTTGHDLTISRQAPFATTARKASSYEYLLLGPTFSFHLTDIHLSGQFTAVSSCCTCYENTRKEARVNGGPTLDLRGPANQPVYIDLRK